MLLLIDIGNTNIVLGIEDKGEIVKSFRIASDQNKTTDEYGFLIKTLLTSNQVDLTKLEAVVISSVVPKLSFTIPKVIRTYLGIKVIEVGVGTKTGIEIRYDNPREVGSDRIVNSLAAYEIYGGPAIIVDMGTAISFDVINEKGAYLGGAIAPGIESASNSLFTRASRLPKVELERPKKAIGKTTNQSLQSGIVLGYISLIDGLVERLAAEMELSLDDVKVIATGGFTDLILNETKHIEYIDPNLTLKGLKFIYEKNS